MKKFLNVMYIILGVVMIIFGVICIGESRSGFAGSYIADLKFGADFYTEIYNSTRQINSTIENLGELIAGLNISVYTGYLLIFLGVKNCIDGIVKINELNEREIQNREVVMLLAEISRKMSVNNLNSQGNNSSYIPKPIVKTTFCPECGYEQPTGSTRCVKCSALLDE